MIERDVKRFVFDFVFKLLQVYGVLKIRIELVPCYGQKRDEASDPVLGLDGVHARFDEHSGGSQAA